jgi:hypothetical protein
LGAAAGHTQNFQFSPDPPPEDWWAKLDTTKVDTTREELSEQKLVKVEVTSAERTSSGMIIVEWDNKTIRLNSTAVDRIERSGGHIYIWIWEKAYESEFANNEQE